MKKISLLLAIIMMASCKTQSVVTEPITPAIYLKSKTIINKHYDNKKDFSTLYVKANVRYADDKQTQNVTAEIKIKKDEEILVSIRFLGITMAKASITPKSVRYYEKIKGTYFEGDFSTLSKWLGTDLDYTKMQNMLIGEAIDDLNKGKYTESLLEQMYRLDDNENGGTKKSFYIDASDFEIKKQEVSQPTEERMILISYSDPKTNNEITIPSNVVINSYQKDKKSEIKLDYNTISFNEELSFPYSVPNGYNKVIIK
ncbi:DUF4292 domain-containing protein [Flavobacterium frigidarium]|uniref:DUF4292 domain-containing protein n=1 Tax=Flavobacterium frigidarium TaxID=99286 RepID=UPI000478699E|nr:DUF4292 domain-containing protein [Flavobacterium frigidarium]